MNSIDLFEYPGLAPFETVSSVRSSTDDQASSSLLRLVAKIHRRASAPWGYRFVANIAASDLARALVAVKYSSTAGGVRLVTSAVDEAGNSVPDVAVYVRNDLPEPQSFWSMFNASGQGHAA